MPVYAVVRASDQAEVYRYRYDAPLDFNEFPAPDYSSVALDEGGEPVPDEPAPVYGGRRLLTKLEYLRLFTQDERLLILQANDTGQYEANGQTITLDAPHRRMLKDSLYMLDLADTVDLDSPEIQYGQPLLEQAGLIGPGRAEEILRG